MIEKIQLSNLSRPSPFGGVLSPPKGGSDSVAAVAALLRRRRRLRRIRFVLCEGLAVGVMISSAVAAISERFADDAFTPLFRVLPIAAAGAAAIIPILFYGIPGRR